MNNNKKKVNLKTLLKESIYTSPEQALKLLTNINKEIGNLQATNPVQNLYDQIKDAIADFCKSNNISAEDAAKILTNVKNINVEELQRLINDLIEQEKQELARERHQRYQAQAEEDMDSMGFGDDDLSENKIISESKLKSLIKKTIKKVIKENFMTNNNAFSDLNTAIEDKRAEVSNEIEALNNQLSAYELVIPTLQRIDTEIREKFKVNGPINGKYSGTYTYKLLQNIPYDDDASDFEYYVNDMIKDSVINDAIDLYVKTDKSNNYIIGFDISVDLDQVKGWY